MTNKSKKIIDTLKFVEFPKGLSFGQSLMILYWTIFSRKKFLCFIDNLDKGMSLIFAYKSI
jgi:hypothetical protein